MLRFTGCHSCFMELFSSVLKRKANVGFILSSSTYTPKIQSKNRPQLKSLFYSIIASYQSALWIHNFTKYEETTRVQMVFAVTTQTLPRRSSVSQCRTFHGTSVNAILLTTVIKEGPSLSADLLCRISQNSARRYGKYGYTFIYVPKCGFPHCVTFLWTPTPNFIKNERKRRNCGVGGITFALM